MRANIRGLIFFCLATACGPSNASATIINVTYMGNVSNGTDATGVFGSANSSLNGDAYTLVYNFNSSMGRFLNRYANGPPDSTGSELSGGPGFGSNLFSSPGDAVLTINGRSVTIAVNSGLYSQGYSQYYALNYGSNIFTEQHVYDLVNDPSHTSLYVENNIDTYINDYTLKVPLLLTTPYTLTIGPGVDTYSQFSLFAHDWSNGNNWGPWQTDFVQAYGTLTPTSVTVSAIPELSTWAMMILGLAGIGGYMAYRSDGCLIRRSSGIGITYLRTRAPKIDSRRESINCATANCGQANERIK